MANVEIDQRQMQFRIFVSDGPGHPRQRRRGKLSDFGQQLKAKQKLKGYYGNITERQFRRVYEEANRRRGDTGENLIELLERRLVGALRDVDIVAVRGDGPHPFGRGTHVAAGAEQGCLHVPLPVVTSGRTLIGGAYSGKPRRGGTYFAHGCPGPHLRRRASLLT